MQISSCETGGTTQQGLYLGLIIGTHVGCRHDLALSMEKKILFLSRISAHLSGAQVKQVPQPNWDNRR